MKQLGFLLLSLLFLSGCGKQDAMHAPGCWTGDLLPENHIAYRHVAVAWVYKTGGQIGRFGVLPVRVDNELLDLQPGDACVHVTEGQKGGQCSAAPQANMQTTLALDLKTGRPVRATAPPQHVGHPEPKCIADQGHWEIAVEDLSVYSAGETGCLYLRLPFDLLVLQVKYPDPQVTYQPWLGVPITAFRMPGNLLVVGLSQGYVLCLDLAKLPASPSAQAQTAQTEPSVIQK